MQRGQWLFRIAAVTMSVTVAGSVTAFAQQSGIAADHAAAIIVYPYVVVDSAHGAETFIQLSNAAATPIDVECFYEDTTGHCSSAPATTCFAPADCPSGDLCVPGFAESNFRLQLTSGQPIGWRASVGSPTLPCSSVPCGPSSESNTGGVPSVAEDPFVGVLRCIALDPSLAPTDQNVLEGAARIEHFQAPASLDAARYNAIGIQAVAGANDGDPTLCVGDGPPAACPLGAEYAACPRTTIVTHFFEGATNPPTANLVRTAFALVPCGVDYSLQQPTSLLVHYNLFNEFEQRLGTSKHFTAQQIGSLSTINPTIFNVGVQGTLTGQTRLLPIGGGLLAVAIETHQDPSDLTHQSTATVNAHHTGAQTGGDTIVLPP
jgi:hypothetical protein